MDPVEDMHSSHHVNGGGGGGGARRPDSRDSRFLRCVALRGSPILPLPLHAPDSANTGTDPSTGTELANMATAGGAQGDSYSASDAGGADARGATAAVEVAMGPAPAARSRGLVVGKC